MAIELKVPEIGESITEVELGDWLKQSGDSVGKDEPVVILESEKATVELPSPEAGTLSKILKQKGDVAKIGEVLAYLEPAGAAAAKKSPSEAARAAMPPPAAVPKVEPGLEEESVENGKST